MFVIKLVLHYMGSVVMCTRYYVNRWRGGGFGGLMEGRQEGNVLFNNTLNTFYLWLYGVGYGK